MAADSPAVKTVFEKTTMTTIAAPTTKQARPTGVGRIALASLVGTTIEFYDFYIFGTAAALVFGPMFFPKSAPETQTLNAYLTFGIAFLARPVGSFLFGHFGDRIGRKSTLVATMLTMGLATTLIGALPSYASAGVFAPIALAALRFLQGVGLGGEWGGAALIAVENAPKENARGTACSRNSGRRSASSSRPGSFFCCSSDRRGGFCHVGLASAFPPERRAGGDRTLCARLARGDAGIRGA